MMLDITHAALRDLGSFLNRGDVIVVNRAGTLPASFRGCIQRTGESLEVRLAAFRGLAPIDLRFWSAVAFGAGDWRIETEARGPAPKLIAGDTITLGTDLSIIVDEVIDRRILAVQFLSKNLIGALYRYGRPIQYSYHKNPLAIWDQQTIFSGPPISVEPPSASFSFDWTTINRMKNAGIEIASILHSAGLSSTGDSQLDRLLPLPEWFQVAPCHPTPHCGGLHCR
jgi:S-adenosylmethionine:tRNA ribosyltransferase-isomerase